MAKSAKQTESRTHLLLAGKGGIKKKINFFFFLDQQPDWYPAH